MEEAEAVRQAARDAVRDIEPDRLRADIVERLDATSQTPGVMTLASARALDGEPADGVLELAAGVQLVYEGLNLTEHLATDEPWTRGAVDEGDLGIIVADVLVSRGFFLLARTEASRSAISMVQAFGRDQSYRVRGEEPDSPDFDLQIDVLKLAILTGQAAAGRPLPSDVRRFTADLVATHDGDLPPVETVASGQLADRLDALLADGEVRTSLE
ncbi:MAG: hypothetical protein ABEJ23_01170 [Haloarculaceae archaeon]